jgi:hypothetical protein
MSISGAYLSAKVNGVAFSGLHGWTASTTGTDKLDATTGADGGYTKTDIGCKNLRVSLKLLFDVTDGITVTLEEGDILSDVELYRHQGDDEPAYDLPEAIVVGDTETVEVRGRIEIDAEIENRGPYTKNRY